jgi:hypothetical protein
MVLGFDGRGSRRLSIVTYRTLWPLACAGVLACAASVHAAPCDVDSTAARELRHAAAHMAALSRRIEAARAMPSSGQAPDLAALEQSLLYESRRSRDIRVILEARRLAEAMARDGIPEQPVVDGADGFLGAVVREMRETMPVDPRELYGPESTASDCSLESALRDAAAAALGKVARMQGFVEIKDTLNRLVEVYGRPLDPERMSDADRERFTVKLLPVIHEAQANTAIAADLIRLAHLESASRMLWAAHRDDVFGASLREWRTTAHITSDQTAAAYVIELIDDQIPAETALTASTGERGREEAR